MLGKSGKNILLEIAKMEAYGCSEYKQRKLNLTENVSFGECLFLFRTAYGIWLYHFSIFG